MFSSERLQDKKNWVQAQRACQDLGAQLLSLASYEEEHFVANMLNKIFGYGAWGGGLHAPVWALGSAGRRAGGRVRAPPVRPVRGLGMTCVSTVSARTMLSSLR